MDGRRIPLTILATVLALVVAVVVVVLLLTRGDGRRAEPPVDAFFPVNTYEWDGGARMEALIGGTLAFTDGGCTLLVEDTVDGPHASAVFFPNATGVRYENGARGVVDGRGRVFAIEGEQFSYGGGTLDVGEGLRSSWDDRCSDTPFTEASVIQDTTTRPPLEAVPPEAPALLPTAPDESTRIG